MAILSSMVDLEKMHDWLKWLSWLNSQAREDSETAWSNVMVELPSIVEVYKRQYVAEFVEEVKMINIA